MKKCLPKRELCGIFCSGQRVVLFFHDLKQEQQMEAAAFVLRIEAGNFPDSFQLIDKCRALHVQAADGPRDTHVFFEIHFQRTGVLPVMQTVVGDQVQEAGRTERFYLRVAGSPDQQMAECVIFVPIIPESGVGHAADLEYAGSLAVVVVQMKQIMKFGADSRFQRALAQKIDQVRQNFIPPG